MTQFVSAPGTLCAALVLALTPLTALAQDTDDAASRNQALVKRFFDTTLSAGDVSDIDQIIAEGYVQHNPLVPQGRDGFVSGLAEFRGAFPDYRSRIDRIVATDTEVWVLHTASGTQCGTYFDMAPSQRRFEIQILDIFRIEDGLLAEHWDVFPADRMMAQLADVAQPAQPAACG